MPLAALGPILLGAAGTSAAATTAAWGAIGAGATAGLGFAGASKQAGAAQRAAELQTASANRAADIQAKAAADALAFQRQQAEADWRNSEITRQANYEQWRSGQQRLSPLGELLGLGPRQIPGYVPSIDPNLNPSSASSSPTAVNPMDPRVSQIIAEATKNLPPTSESLDPIIAALNKAGIPASRARHGANGSLASDDKIALPGGGGIDLIRSVGAPDAAWQFSPYGSGIAGSNAMNAGRSSYFGRLGDLTANPQQPYASLPLTAPLPTPTAWQAPRSLGSVLG